MCDWAPRLGSLATGGIPASSSGPRVPIPPRSPPQGKGCDQIYTPKSVNSQLGADIHSSAKLLGLGALSVRDALSQRIRYSQQLLVSGVELRQLRIMVSRDWLGAHKRESPTRSGCGLWWW